jgi:DNA-binding HxlR family transcriptional regulator
MRWQDVGAQPCSIARSLSVIGDRWTMLLIRNAFLGTRRFDDFQALLGVTRHVLADRLQKLVEFEVLKKVPYQDKPPRFEYRLTERGRELYPVLLALVNWGDKWMDEGRGPPVLYTHHNCGKQFRPVMSCSECGEALNPREVTPMPGPGLVVGGA